MTDPTVDSDWPCAACGYNLRTQRRDGACPECGAEVAKSLKARWLVLADAAWLRRIRLGITCLAIAALLRLVLPWLLQYMPRLGPFLNGYSIGGRNSFVFLIWPVCLLPGAMLLSRGEMPAYRWPGRWLLWVTLAHVAFLLAAIVVRHVWWGGWNPAFNVMMDSEPMFVVPEVWLIIRAVESLSARIPERPMAREAGAFRRLFCLILLTQAVALLTLQFASWRGWPARISPFTVLFSIIRTTYYSVIPFWLYLPMFLLRFRGHLASLHK